MTDTQIPEELRYTKEHEWIRKTGSLTVRVGVTDYAQQALNDVVFVQLPEVDSEVEENESFAEVESHKSVSDIYGPLNGTVSAVNDALEASPELVNSDPYGDGWLCEITVADDVDLDAVLGDLLDAAGYRAVISD
ncbi:MAG: glycine cleavage system protein GcvH [Gordonia sp. (in: high G+C Gram-positive bacteria)]|uniref:glycine cleavage system protein GcvH n=1 Tax=Gordonia sp. (in: high G+C Gram-positive bacteria) TaxID=84139 RepID=UPI0039E3B3F6